MLTTPSVTMPCDGALFYRRAGVSGNVGQIGKQKLPGLLMPANRLSMPSGESIPTGRKPRWLLKLLIIGAARASLVTIYSDPTKCTTKAPASWWGFGSVEKTARTPTTGQNR